MHCETHIKLYARSIDIWGIPIYITFIFTLSVKFELRPYQKEASQKAVEFFLDTKKNWNALEVLPTGCHAKGTKILMYDGQLKNVEDIKVGDEIMGDDSTRRTVLALHQGYDDMYKITPTKGVPFVVNGGHILHLYKTSVDEVRKRYKEQYDEISVSAYLLKNDSYKQRYKLHRAKVADLSNHTLEQLVTGFSVEHIGIGAYFGFTLDGNHLYCDEQFFVHHNSGKSLIIADIAANLSDKVLVFSPTKEILEQNFKKYCSYGFDNASIYSASFNSREISDVTFATIGSVKSCPELFSSFKYVIVDECHLCKPEEGMYKTFFKELKCKVLGLTATPYRLYSYQEYGSILKFLTRMSNKLFKELLYYVQIEDMVNNGYLARPKYYECPPVEWNEGNLQLNSTCRDYTDKSVVQEYERVDMYHWLVSVVKRLQHPKSGIPRKGILVFTKFVKEAEMLARSVPSCEMVCGETPMKERDAIIERFKTGKTKVLVNSQVLVVGFDYPALDTVVMARPTRSLSQYYQILGRILRPYKGKEPWFVDICGTFRKFGKVEQMKIVDLNNKGKWAVMSGDRQLTNTFF